MRKVLKAICLTGFVLYAVLMLYLLYGQRMGLDTSGTYLEQLSHNYNLVPFKTVAEYIDMAINNSNPYMRQHAVINLAGNVAMFIPLGFFLPCVWSKVRKYHKHLLYSVLIISAIEITQFFSLLGSCDIDDLILNLVGTSLGFLIFKAVRYIHGKILS